MDRKQETKIVKEALKAAGIEASVKHGQGTAWGWLDITLVNVPRSEYRQIHDQALTIAQQVTGRHGEYNGEICIYN